MKSAIKRVPLVIGLSMFFLTGFAQEHSYQNYKFVNGNVEGFTRCDKDSIAANIAKTINREIKNNLFQGEDTVMYLISADGSVCAGFISKYWEGTYLVVDKYGKLIQKIVFINPEGKEYNSIYDQIINSEYIISDKDFPLGPIRKIITPSRTWYEVFTDKRANEDYETVLIFNNKLKQIAIEKAR